MLPALGAVSSALDALQSLTSSKSSPRATGFSQAAANPFDLSGGTATSGSPDQASATSGFSRLSPSTMNALLAAQSQATTTTSTPTSPSAALQDMFSQLDADHNGQISKTEFESALGAGGTNLAQAEDVLAKLDKDGSGTVSLDEMSAALKGRGHHRYHHAGNSTEAPAIASPAAASVSVTV